MKGFESFCRTNLRKLGTCTNDENLNTNDAGKTILQASPDLIEYFKRIYLKDGALDKKSLEKPKILDLKIKIKLIKMFR